jgi:D-amino peptidase
VKVFIISDIEGVAGIVKGDQTGPKGDAGLFQEGRKLYTEEINASVRGAKSAGATEIVVMDCHGAGNGYTFNSLIPEDLDADCEFVVQDQWTEYIEFLEQGVDAALFVGMHARAGAENGVLNHTVSGPDFQNLWFNDTLVGETGINAALCGAWGCPVLMVTGDQAACREGKELLGEGLTTVQVKQGTGVQSARSLVPSRARELIEAGAKQALQDLKAVAPYVPDKPCAIKVEYKWTDPVAKLRYRHGVEALDSRTIVSRADDWWTAWKQFFF